jgi:hypothetical protein
LPLIKLLMAPSALDTAVEVEDKPNAPLTTARPGVIYLLASLSLSSSTPFLSFPAESYTL